MSEKSSSISSGGLDVCGLLGIVFVTLKLLGITAVAEWSWWLVTLPFWGGFALMMFLLVLFGIIAAAASKR